MCRRQPRHQRCSLFPLAAILAVSVLGSGRAAAQTITEIINTNGDGAGNLLFGTEDIAVDAVGNAYVTGFDSNNAFKITPGGVITEIIDATGDGAGNALVFPRGIAVDAAGNAYVAGQLSDNAFKITPAGVITEIIDATGDGAGNSLGGAFGITVDAAGNTYVTGGFSDNAFKITPGGVITEIIDATGDGAGNILDNPLGITVDAAGNAYVTGVSSDNAFKITPGGVITEIIDATGDGAGNGLVTPAGIAVDAANNVYVTGFNSDNAFKITPAGVITEIIDATGDGAGNVLGFPRGIAVDTANNVHVTGEDSNNAFRITSGGVITEIINSNGDGAGNALVFPRGIAVDAAGNAYVAGSGTNNAFKITVGPTREDLLEAKCDSVGCRECEDGYDVTCGGQIGDDKAFSDPVNLHSGEFTHTEVDLRIPGRGSDFVWSRKYRSRTGTNTAMGNNWDFSYNISLQQDGPNLQFCDGTGRTDHFDIQTNGTWTRHEYYRVIDLQTNGSHTMTHADRTVWTFAPFDGAPQEGKITAMTDRNGNAMTFDYNTNGQLVTIHDTLDTAAHNRDITIGYNSNGLIESVTDFIGREIRYEYYQDGDAGGSAGDLKSARSPTVIGTPNGNDFPAGKTWTYTYSKGLGDENLNHNLLTATDGRGNLYLINEYATETDPAALLYDHVVSQTYGGDRYDYFYVQQTPSAGNNFAVIKTIVNNRNGDVKELFYDNRNRLVILQEFTGRADPLQPTTDATNRPVAPLRPGDPPFFETRYTYNDDSLATTMVDANTNVMTYAYDSSNPSPRSRGNLLQKCTTPGSLGGDQAQICEQFEYDAGFGGCCGSNFVTRHVDGRGNETLRDYNSNGDLIQVTHRIPSIVEDFEYNPFGQMTAHVLPDNGSAHRRRDEYTYYAAGTQLGYRQNEIVDAGGFALTTTYEYDPVGNVTRVTDPRGHDTQYVVNELNQVVREKSRLVTGVRYERDTFYDGNDNVVRLDIQNVDETGALQANTHFTDAYDYDILNYLIRQTEEIDPGKNIVTEYEYDANRNRTLVRYGEAVNGNQPNNVVATEYDERDLVFKEIRAPTDPDQSTTQYDYDGNRNTVLKSVGLEDVPHLWTYTYDGYDRAVSRTDPMGNVTTYHYDANHNKVGSRTDGETTDVPGSGGNVRLTDMTYVYDPLDRLTQEIVEFFDTDTQTPIDDGQSVTLTEYSDNSQVTRVVDDNVHQTLTTYDTANRRGVVTDHRGNTATYSYDDNSNVTSTTETEKSDLGNPDQVFVTTYAYDFLDRLIQSVDNVGNTHTYAYDSRDNRTVTTDALGNVTRYAYDGINRLIETTRFLTDTGTGGGNPAGTIVTAQTWDDTSRLVGQTDDNGNTTTYVYDALNRMTAEVYADTTTHSYTLDVHDNRLTITDANGSVATCLYDLLDRLTGKTIVPGAGVSADTTFENYEYDGLSRLVSAQDDDSLVTRSYDSLSRATRETLNGQTTTSIYDGVGNKLTCVYPGGRTITCTYDVLDRKQTISDGAGLIATYDYVGPGRVERRTYNTNGTQTDYTYDGITGVPNPPNDFGVKHIIGTTHTVTVGGAVLDDRTYTWDKMYNKTRRKDVRVGGPGMTHDYAYDSLYRLVNTQVTDPVPVVRRITSYILDGVGNRTVVTGPDGGDYVMDPLAPPADFPVNQYTSTPFNRRTYDDNGNLTRMTAPGDCDTDGDVDLDDYNGASGFAACFAGPGITVNEACRCSDFDHDDDVDEGDYAGFQRAFTGAGGGLPGAAIAYDYRNRMVEYVDVGAGQTHRYAYDALGRRIVRTVDALAAAGGPFVTRYFYDGWRVSEEQNGGGTVQATYVYGLYIDEVLNMQRGGSNYYYHTDDLYNVMAVTDSSGTVVERYEYADYGQPIDPTTLAPIVGDPSAIGNPYLFTGRRYDAETGWYHYRTRYLDPAAGRFTTRDAIGIWGDAGNLGNGYSYVGNNPWTMMDPLGRQKLGLKTVSAATPVDCGGFKWVIQWILDKVTTKGGWINQHLKATFDVKDCDGKGVKHPADDGKWDYSEAWKVNKNQKVTTYAQGGDTADDTYQIGTAGDCTKGKVVFKGVAEFHDGLAALPKEYKANNPDTHAGILPSTTKTVALAGGTGAMDHSLEATWDCCTKNKKTTLKTTP